MRKALGPEAGCYLTAENLVFGVCGLGLVTRPIRVTFGVSCRDDIRRWLRIPVRKIPVLSITVGYSAAVMFKAWRSQTKILTWLTAMGASRCLRDPSPLARWHQP